MRETKLKVDWTKVVPEAKDAGPGEAIEVDLRGVCSVEGRPDLPCRVSSLTLLALTVHVETRACVGDVVVMSLGTLGLLKATVASVGDGFLEATVDERRDSKLGRFVDWLRRPNDGRFDGRTHERIVPLARLVKVTRGDSTEVLTRIIDVSRSGLALVDDGKFEKGERLMAGSHPATVARTWENGAAVAFERTLEEIDPTVDFH